MANSISGFYSFSAGNLIRSSQVNSNLAALVRVTPMWQKYTIPYTSYSALGASISSYVVACSLGADEIIEGFYISHSVAFSGGAISAAKIKVGTPSTANKYVDEFDVFSAASTSNNRLESGFFVENSSTSIAVTLSLTGGNLNALAAGSVDIYVKKSSYTP